MATLAHVESKRLYSWWWDSHISPKNSKWLQENLADMDIKIKAMIKLIEEDADSFAMRAEMYYKKRPELMKLVEEFYRAYRALAERYGHATGALCHAHQRMKEAFPNEIPFVSSDECPGSYTTDAVSHTPEMSPAIFALFSCGDSRKDASVSSQVQCIARNREYDTLISIKEPIQFEKFGCEEETIHANSTKMRRIKSLDLQDESEEGSKTKILQEDQLESEFARADIPVAEVRGLKDTISKLNCKKEASLLQNQLSLEIIAKMETELAHSEANCSKLNDEMLVVIGKLNSAEEQCLLLEKFNQSLQLELDKINNRDNKQQEELNKHAKELERLKSSLQEEQNRLSQAETARLPFEKLHSESQESIRLLNLEIQTGTEKLKDIELRRMGLEEELQKLKEENGSLNQQQLASALKIINLQDEVIVLRDLKLKHEDETKLHKQELSCLKEDKSYLEHNRRRLAKQLEEVSSRVESLEVLIEELKNENEELKEICKKHDCEKVFHLAKLKSMEKISDKNVVLESSVSDANFEIESLREKIKALEEFCESLCSKIDLHLSEKAAFVSEAEAASHNMEQVSEENILLEKSISDANTEIESLKGKLKTLEESCQSLHAQNFNILSEKCTLVSQVEDTAQSLQSMKASYEELESKHLNLEREKYLIVQQIMELEDSFKQEKEEYETLILSIMLSSKSQMSSVENEICLLQEEGRLREEEFEAEQNKVLNSQMEIFILQMCLCDMNDKNYILSVECQKLFEALKSAEVVISELKQELIRQEEELTSSEECNEKLREGIQLMLRDICINKHCKALDDAGLDLPLQLTLHEFRGFLNSFSDSQEENHRLLLENLVIITILEQFCLSASNMMMCKDAFEKEPKMRTGEFLRLQSKHLEFLEASGRVDMQAGNWIQELWNAEMKVWQGYLRDTREAYSKLQGEVCKLIEENQVLAENNYSLREKKEILEGEYSVILVEALAFENLSLIFSNSGKERMLELQLMANDVADLRGFADGFDEDVELLCQKLGAIETENMYLKEIFCSFVNYQNIFMIHEDGLKGPRNVCERSTLGIESGKDIFMQNEIEHFQANQKIIPSQNKNSGLPQDTSGSLVLREKLENKIFNLSEENQHRNNEIACFCRESKRLGLELDRLHTEVEDLRSREGQVASELQKGIDNVNFCESEIATLLNNIQIITVDAAIFEEKVFELLIECENLEISGMVQGEILHEEITLRTANMDELKEKVDTMERDNRVLQEELDAYLLLLPALSDDVTSLEKHMLSLAKYQTSHCHEKMDNHSVLVQHTACGGDPSQVNNEPLPVGILVLEKLHAKIKALQKLVIDAKSLLEQEISESGTSSKAAVEDIEVLKLKRDSSPMEMQINKDIMQMQNGDAGISPVNSEQMMKDIQLDLVLSSSQCRDDVDSYKLGMLGNAGTSDQDIDLCELTKKNQMQKLSSSMEAVGKEYKQIELMKEEKNKYPSSKLEAEKVLDIDTQVVHKKDTDYYQEWNRRVIEGLSSDSQRLLVLQTKLQDLKRNIETTEMNKNTTSFEFDTVKAQLKEAEISCLQLIDINSSLKKKAGDSLESSDIMNEVQTKNRRQISERARRISEKIGRLELEMHKIHHILLKLKEEYEMKKATNTSKRKSLLRDYLYGKLDSSAQQRSPCQCIRPKTRN